MTLHDIQSSFHFLRPAWLLTWPLLMALAVWLARRRGHEAGWSAVIDAELLSALRLDGDTTKPGAAPWLWLALAWSLCVIALAGPTWQREPSAAFRAPDAWVVVLDLSPSMLSSDVAPNRVTRARYAIDDILGAAHDARVALLAFSDEPYTVTPLTDDVATVRALLSPLEPGIMPSAGDQLATTLDKAQQLLDRAGAVGGHVIVLSDGFADPAAALTAAGRLRARGTAVDVIAIGTARGAPQQQADGSFARDAQGHPQMARLDEDLLRRLASTGGGQEVDLNQVPKLITHLQSAPQERMSGATRLAHVQTDRWRDAGAWLLPALVVLAALLSRRGWL